MAHGNTGNAGKSSPLEGPPAVDKTEAVQAVVGTVVDGGLALVEEKLAQGLGAAAVAAVKAAQGAFAAAFGVLGIGIGMALAAKEGKGPSGVASAGFAGFASAV